jgi:hypothetical protein
LRGILTINSDSTKFYNRCHVLLDHFSKSGIWIQGSGTAGYVPSGLVFQNYMEDKRKEDSKVKMDP